MGSHGDSVLESGRATAVQPSGAAVLLFSRQEAHAILRPGSGRIRARCELVGRSQLWPEELTFKRKTGRSESGQKRRFDNRPVTSGLPPTSDFADSASHVGFVPIPDMSLSWWYDRRAEMLLTKPVDFARGHHDPSFAGRVPFYTRF